MIPIRSHPIQLNPIQSNLLQHLTQSNTTRHTTHHATREDAKRPPPTHTHTHATSSLLSPCTLRPVPRVLFTTLPALPSKVLGVPPSTVLKQILLVRMDDEEPVEQSGGPLTGISRSAFIESFSKEDVEILQVHRFHPLQIPQDFPQW